MRSPPLGRLTPGLPGSARPVLRGQRDDRRRALAGRLRAGAQRIDLLQAGGDGRIDVRPRDQAQRPVEAGGEKLLGFVPWPSSPSSAGMRRSRSRTPSAVRALPKPARDSLSLRSPHRRDADGGEGVSVEALPVDGFGGQIPSITARLRRCGTTRVYREPTAAGEPTSLGEVSARPPRHLPSTRAARRPAMTGAQGTNCIGFHPLSTFASWGISDSRRPVDRRGTPLVTVGDTQHTRPRAPCTAEPVHVHPQGLVRSTVNPRISGGNAGSLPQDVTCRGAQGR